MSDTMTTGEIEDVLSSIRRLVTEELRPHPRVQAAVASKEADKLILTPALRVVEDGPAAVPEAEPVRLDGVVSAIGAAVSEPEDGWESETGDAPLLGMTFSSSRGAPPHQVLHLEREQTVHDDAPVAFEAAAEDDRAAFGAGDTKDALWSDETAADASGAEPLSGDDAAMDRAEAEARAEIEDAVARAPYVDRSDDAGFDDADLDFADPHDADPGFDEEALRDMVRDIIREELQGTLGERITRNIRKLVRAEIHRALTAREFE